MSDTSATTASDDLRPVRLELAKVPKGSLGIEVRWLGPWHGLILHYGGEEGSTPCGQRTECRKCRPGSRVQWRGYASVLVPANKGGVRIWVHAILEVTERLGEQLDGLELRGRHDRLNRVQARGDRLAVQAALLGSVNIDSLPPPCNVQAWAEAFFRWPDLLMGARDPRPRAQYLVPVPAGRVTLSSPVPTVEAIPPAPDAKGPNRTDAAEHQAEAKRLIQEQVLRMRMPTNGSNSH
jgi:hypothetical protein